MQLFRRVTNNRCTPIVDAKKDFELKKNRITIKGKCRVSIPIYMEH